jgi:hypothetical protein
MRKQRLLKISALRFAREDNKVLTLRLPDANAQNEQQKQHGEITEISHKCAQTIDNDPIQIHCPKSFWDSGLGGDA